MREKRFIRVLVEFEFIIDLDLAIFKLIRDKYNNPDIINQDIINNFNEPNMIEMLINRENINPLELFVDKSCDVTDLYYDIYNNHMDELLEYAKAYDTFGLMVTYLKLLSDVKITVLCESQLQADFIASLNKILPTVIAKRESIHTSQYDSFYIKYYANSLKYVNLNGKNIYIANAMYNVEEDRPFIPKVPVSAVVGYTNKIHLVDLYKDIKFNNSSHNNG